MSHQRDTRTVLRALLTAVQDSPLTMLAAGIAYYAFVSLFPLWLLGLAVATTIGGETMALAIVEAVSGVLSPSGEELVQDALLDGGARGGATVVGLLVLAWGGLKLFRGLDTAFSLVYGTQGSVTFLGQLRNAGVALGAVGLAIAATVAVALAAGVLGIRIVGTLGTVALAVALTGAFLPLYYVFPDVGMTLRDALPGAAFAAVGWTLLSTGFRLYAANAGTSVYGVVGAVLLLVTWFYVSGIVLLLGAVLNGVLSGDVGAVVEPDRQLQQARLRETGQRAMSEPGDDDTEADEPDEPLRERDRDRSQWTAEELADLREDLEDLETRIDERTVHRDDLEDDLQEYVRWRSRRGHARGWGPYLVLLYGTVMTLGAFYFLAGVWAVLAMLVIWLSTLGLYALMLLVGAGINAVTLPGRLKDRFL